MTQSWGRKVVVEARPPRERPVFRRALRLLAGAAVAALLVAGAAVLIGRAGPVQVAADGPVAVWRTSSGLATSLSFHRPLPVRDLGDAFAFNGSATPGVGYASLDRSGLTIGVHGHPDRFEGWFAVTRAAYPGAGAYHVLMAKPPGNVDRGNAQGEAVFAVQTGTTKLNGLINYVVVASNSSRGATTWTIGYAHGHVADARLETLAQFPVPATSPVARDITLTTDGRHRLAVWFGQGLVYASSRLHLDIAPPFQPYLEVQSRLVPYTSFFHDFWVTTGTGLTVSAPSGARLRLVGAGGAVLATGVARQGTARLALPPPRARGTATLVVQMDGRRYRLGPFAYAGGDHYRVTGLASTPGAVGTTGR